MATHRSLSIWLLIGCILVLGQIVIGGITRLTDSGLSITEWNVIKGTLPPMNDLEWNHAFDQYKSIAKKQYESIHRNMTLEEFKRIYFWEYFHRLWARMMGFIFIIPCVFFILKKWIDKTLFRRLLIVLLLASLAAVFGWIMVASGLSNDKRTWVNAYNLLGHLIIATSLFSYLVYTYYSYSFSKIRDTIAYRHSSWIGWLGLLLFVQIGLGALMAGMKAGLVFPFPFTVFKFSTLIDIVQHSPLSWAAVYDYEPNASIKIIIQIVHRMTAYLLLITSAIFLWKNQFYRDRNLWIFCLLLCTQVILGIMTVSFAIGRIPIVYGVLHQLVAFLLLASYLWIYFISKKN